LVTEGRGNNREDQGSMPVPAHSPKGLATRLRPGEPKTPRRERSPCPAQPLRPACGHSPRRHYRTRCAHRLPPDSRGSGHRTGPFVEHKPVVRSPVERPQKLPSPLSTPPLPPPPTRTQPLVLVSNHARAHDLSCPFSGVQPLLAKSQTKQLLSRSVIKTARSCIQAAPIRRT
jgi:hypothetical protein